MKKGIGDYIDSEVIPDDELIPREVVDFIRELELEVLVDILQGRGETYEICLPPTSHAVNFSTYLKSFLVYCLDIKSEDLFDLREKARKALYIFIARELIKEKGFDLETLRKIIDY